MKTIFPKYLMLLLILSGFSWNVGAQYMTATDNIAGLDLDQVKRQYERAIQRGDSSYTIHFAEALYMQSEFERAFEMYKIADQLGLIVNKYQQRDFVHAGRRVGKETPYTEDTGYFDRSWDLDVKVSAFCSNSPREDFAPFYWKDLLFITSSRNMSGRQYEFTQNPFLNVHTFIHDCISAKIPDGLPEDINTENHDGPIAISEDGNLLIITRNHTKKSSDNIYNLYMHYYVRTNNKWSEAKTFPLADKEFSVQHPYYADEDSTLYFSSNVDGGHGGFDIYKSTWDGSRWSKPVNLGPEVNSHYDEVFPSMAPWGDLIYASNHMETTGGLDLVLFKDTIRHLFPAPFNTLHDDFSITFKNESSGYFASNRDVQGFNDDIYVFEIIGPFWPEYDFYVEVIDDETHEPLENVQAVFSSKPAEGELFTSEEGLGFLHSGDRTFCDYHFQLSKEGYQDKGVVSDSFVKRDDRFILTLKMKRVVDPIEEETLAQGYFELYFDNDRPDPRSTSPSTQLSYQQTFHAYMLRKDDYYRNSASSREELDAFFQDVEKGMEQLQWLVRYIKEEMEESREYTIIFTSHASPLASSEYNLILSQRRFVSVENFIQRWDNRSLQRFIDTGKLDYENNPFGESQARSEVSSDRQEPARSIYSVEAARERKVTVTWRRNDAEKDMGDTGSAPAMQRTEQPPQSQPDQQFTTPGPQNDPGEAQPDETPSQKAYHVIVGSYTTQQEAQNEANRLRNLYSTGAAVLPMAENGRYRVSYGSYPGRQDAEAALRSIRNNVRADAWILAD